MHQETKSQEIIELQRRKKEEWDRSGGNQAIPAAEAGKKIKRAQGALINLVERKIDQAALSLSCKELGELAHALHHLERSLSKRTGIQPSEVRD